MVIIATSVILLISLLFIAKCFCKSKKSKLNKRSSKNANNVKKNIKVGAAGENVNGLESTGHSNKILPHALDDGIE